MPRRKNHTQRMSSVPILLTIFVSLTIGGIIGYANGQAGSVSHTWTEITGVAIGTDDILDTAVTEPKIAPDSVDGSKIVDGSLTKIDVDQTEICVSDDSVFPHVPSAGCPDLSEFTCKQVYNGFDDYSHKAVAIPDKCLGGSCSLIGRAIRRDFAAPDRWAAGVYSQFPTPTGSEQWTLVESMDGSNPSLVLDTGYNGDTTSTVMFSWDFGVSTLSLRDDLSSTEINDNQWTMVINTANWYVLLYAC